MKKLLIAIIMISTTIVTKSEDKLERFKNLTGTITYIKAAEANHYEKGEFEKLYNLKLKETVIRKEIIEINEELDILDDYSKSELDREYNNTLKSLKILEILKK